MLRADLHIRRRVGEYFNGRPLYSVTTKSVFTGAENTLSIAFNPGDYVNWKRHGVNIQVALPYLSADEREFLMTGATAKEWAQMTGGGD